MSTKNEKVAALLAQLTLEEKAALVAGADFWHTAAVERLGIPAYTVSDGPHGVRPGNTNLNADGEGTKTICFPTGCALAASWDTDLLRKIGEALGDECAALDIAVLLGPAINIKRSPLCGRNFEYLSEDPVLTGHAAAALIEGVQGRGTGVSMKHFAVNNQESARLSVDAQVSERALREIYLAGFEYAVRNAKPRTLMCSYNRINGTHASQNPWLLTEVLRGDWGFEGYVMSDWGAVDDRIEALKAGLDLEMPGPSRQTDRILQAIKTGELEEGVLDQSAGRILNDVFKYTKREAAFPYEAHHRLAVEAATECAVLLKNDAAVLPLAKSARAAFIGGFAATPRFQGGGSSKVLPWQVSSALDAAKEAGYAVSFAKGFVTEDDEAGGMFQRPDAAKFEVYDPALAAEAIAAAKAADVAVIFAGLPDSFESEGYDRVHMRLPESQNRLIAEIAAVQPRTVVVLHNGSPVEMPWAAQVPAILEMYLAGEGSGEAALRLLFGDANPSGKLAETFPLRLQDNPSYLSFPGTAQEVSYDEGVYVGYRYYDRREIPVLFPFGHGLSYTNFEYGELRREGYNFSIDVTNRGALRGKEVVQLYAEGYGTVRELKAYAKLDLAPGETKTARFTLSGRDFAHWEQGGWYCANGPRRVEAGSSSRDIRSSLVFEISGAALPPFTVTANTTTAEILADPRTREGYRKILREDLGFDGEAAAFGFMDDMPIGRMAVPTYAEKHGGGNLVEILNGLAKRGA